MGKKKSAAGRCTDVPPLAEMRRAEEAPRVPGEAVAETEQVEEAPRALGEVAEMTHSEEPPRVPGEAGKCSVLFGSTDDRTIASAVHRAARSGKVGMLYAMKELGYPMARKDYNGRLGTHVAAEEG